MAPSCHLLKLLICNVPVALSPGFSRLFSQSGYILLPCFRMWWTLCTFMSTHAFTNPSDIYICRLSLPVLCCCFLPWFCCSIFQREFGGPYGIWTPSGWLPLTGFKGGKWHRAHAHQEAASAQSGPQLEIPLRDRGREEIKWPHMSLLFLEKTRGDKGKKRGK